jgi:hypothetical protein
MSLAVASSRLAAHSPLAVLQTTPSPPLSPFQSALSRFGPSKLLRGQQCQSLLYWHGPSQTASDRTKFHGGNFPHPRMSILCPSKVLYLRFRGAVPPPLSTNADTNLFQHGQSVLSRQMRRRPVVQDPGPPCPAAPCRPFWIDSLLRNSRQYSTKCMQYLDTSNHIAAAFGFLPLCLPLGMCPWRSLP